MAEVSNLPLHVYKVAEEDLHNTNGLSCWCSPKYMCAECKDTAPCIHGVNRVEIVVHNERS